jgi:hypothetical protein
MIPIRIRSASLARFGFVAFAVLISAVLVQPASADVIIGTNDGNPNIFPYGAPSGNNNAYHGEYQQIYTSTVFSGPISISSIAFATAVGSVSITENFTLSLSTTSSTIAAPSSSYAANKGSDFTQVFSGSRTFATLGNGTFDFVIPITPFVYDPAKGNLLLDVNISSSTGNVVTFEATSDAVTSRVYNSGGSGTPTINTDYGLVTTFSSATSSVPEPGIFALILIFASGVFVFRRRTAKS